MRSRCLGLPVLDEEQSILELPLYSYDELREGPHLTSHPSLSSKSNCTLYLNLNEESITSDESYLAMWSGLVQSKTKRSIIEPSGNIDDTPVRRIGSVQQFLLSEFWVNSWGSVSILPVVTFLWDHEYDPFHENPSSVMIQWYPCAKADLTAISFTPASARFRLSTWHLECRLSIEQRLRGRESLGGVQRASDWLTYFL